jgi:tetratricopeptide (TPR) repeat protein
MNTVAASRATEGGEMLQRPWFPAFLATATLACATVRSPAPAPTAAAPPAAAPSRADTAEAAAARLALAENRHVEAEALFSTALAATPGDRDLLVGRARARFALWRPADALADVDHALALRDGADARALRGRQLAVARRFDDALADLERAVALAPQDAVAWCTLAAVHANRGDDVEVRHAFGRAVQLLGAHDAQERCWTELLGMPPDPVRPQESLDRSTRGYVHFLAGEWGAGWREFLVAVRYAPDYVWAVAGVAEAGFRLGDVAFAEKLLRQAIDRYPASARGLRADAQGRLAELLLARGGAAVEARALAHAALAERPERAHLLALLARACDAAGDATCARDARARLLVRPHLPDDLVALARERTARLAPATVSSR